MPNPNPSLLQGPHGEGTYWFARQASKGKWACPERIEVQNSFTTEHGTAAGSNGAVVLRCEIPEPLIRALSCAMTRPVASCAGLAIAASVMASATVQDQAAEHPGKALLEPMCGSCHDSRTVTQIPRTRDDWTETLDQMIRFGAQGSEQDFQQLFDYLLRNYSLVNVNKAPAAELETGLDVTDKVASAVVAYRTEHGPFQTIDDLKGVPGIDAAKLDARANRLRY